MLGFGLLIGLRKQFNNLALDLFGLFNDKENNLQNGQQ